MCKKKPNSEVADPACKKTSMWPAPLGQVSRAKPLETRRRADGPPDVHNMNEFTQQQKDIPAYEAYRLATVELTEQDISLDEFTRILKTDPRFKSLRYQAMKEFKLIYDRVAKDLSLPNIPVFLCAADLPVCPFLREWCFANQT